MTSAPQKNLFGFLVLVYDKVGDGGKLSHENFDLGNFGLQSLRN